MTQITGIEVQLKAARQAEADANRLDKSLDRLGKSGTKAEGTFDRLRRESTKMGTGFEGLKRHIFSLQGALATLGVGIGFGSAINEIASFGREMSVVQAVSRATASDMEKLTATARDLGATTAFSASEAAQGLVALSQAGFSAEQSLAAIRDTLNLAAAGGIGLGEAADLATNTLSQFNLAANEAGRVADVLADAAARSNTTVGQLGIAMRQVGPVAASVGVSFENTTAAISSLSDAGLKGEQAGTGLRAVLASLVDPSKEAAGVIERLGVNVSDLSDPAQVFEQFGKAGMTAQDAVKLFGREAAAAGLILAGTSDKVADLADEFRNADGAAAQMAKTMQDNLGGDIKELSSAMSELVLQTGDKGLTGALRSATQAITELFRVASGATAFSDFRKEFQLLTDTAIALSVVMGARLVSSLTASAQATFVSITAQRAHSLALVEDASRTVASTAAKLAFNNMLVAEAQASVAAATGLSRLTVVQNTLLPAQTRAAAASAAHTAALQAQAAAASKASISAGLLRGSLALLGGPVGVAVVAAGAFALLATRQSDTRKATDAARKANEELNKILGESETLTLATAEAARQKANKDVLAAHAALALAQAEQQKFIAQSGGLAAASRKLGSGGISFSAQSKEIRDQRTALAELQGTFLETDEAVRKFQRTAREGGSRDGGGTGAPSGLPGADKTIRDLTAMEKAQAKFNDAIANYPAQQIIRDLEDQFAAQERLADSAIAKFEEMQSIRERGLQIFKSTLPETEQRKIQEAELQFLFDKGAFGEGQQAVETLERAMENLRETSRGTGDVANDLGLTFSSAFEKAITQAESFRDVLGGLARDMVGIFTRRAVTEPLAAGISNFASGIDFGSIFGNLFHQGGIVGQGGPGRMVPAMAFADAPRYHNGGLSGFMPNERPAVLKVGEEVLPASHPRHRNNQGNAEPPLNITINQSNDFRGANNPAESRAQAERIKQETLAAVEAGIERGGRMSRAVGRRI